MRGQAGTGRKLQVLLGAAVLACGTAAEAQEPITAVERQPSSYENFTTANLLPRYAFELDLGFNQTNPTVDTPGTSNQVYFGDIAFSPIRGLEMGVEYLNFVDPPPEPIAGARPATHLKGGGPYGKLRLFEGGGFTVAGQAAVEWINFRSPIFGGNSNEFEMVGSAHLPITYDISPNLQAHLTPGVSVFPEERFGNPFYGTVASIGGGLSWQPTKRTLLYGTVTQPLTGANTILSDGSYARRPVLTFGGRFAFAPNSAVEVWATNGVGMTPTTGILNFFPDGDIVMVGAKLVHTFGPGAPDKRHYDREPGVRPTPRQRILMGDGFTLEGPRTRQRGKMEAQGFFGTQGARGAAIAIAPDHFLELRASYESIADDGSGSSGKLTSAADRWTGRFKLQFMDEIDGWPVSLGFIASFGRDLNDNGAFYTALPVMREVTQDLAIRAVPKAAFYGNNEELGLGLGGVYAIGRRTNLFAEYTLRNNGDDIWAIGTKTRLKGAPFEIGLHATNAIGAYGVNSMTSQNDPKIVLSVSLLQYLFH